MGYIYYNPNPLNRQNAGDCTVRAISKVLNWDWEKTYAALCIQGFIMGDIPSANSVWGSLLLDHGFEEQLLVRRCRECYTLENFCHDFPDGIYVVGTDNHAVAVINGNAYDSFNSLDIYPTYYFKQIKMEDDVNG